MVALKANLARFSLDVKPPNSLGRLATISASQRRWPGRNTSSQPGGSSGSEGAQNTAYKRS